MTAVKVWPRSRGSLTRSRCRSTRTSKIEELIFSLRGEYTVLIVTHNMQQAARVSDYTAFMYLGNLVEVSPTNVMFLKPARRQGEEYVTGRFG